MPADKPAKRDNRKPGYKAGRKLDRTPDSRPSAKSGGKPGGKPGAKFSGKPRPPQKRGDKVAATPIASGPKEPLRIAKAMARAGLCSRREAERWIEQGRVNVNGRLLTTPAFEVGPKDKVLVDGKALPTAEPPRLWRYYKPRGLVTTHNDPQGRPTVFESLPEDMPRVISVGRLDFNSEGLLLLTNDGALARYMELPSTGWLRRYRVRAHGRVGKEQLDKLKDGIEIEGVRYGAIDAAVDSVQGANSWLTFALREGKNREVRRILAHLGVEVNRLIRLSYGPFQLLDLKPGESEIVKRRVLADQMGTRLAEELHLTAADDEQQKSKRKGSSGKRDDAE
jgi:23S rRNA pseudouridine2605 synthase